MCRARIQITSTWLETNMPSFTASAFSAQNLSSFCGRILKLQAGALLAFSSVAFGAPETWECEMDGTSELKSEAWQGFLIERRSTETLGTYEQEKTLTLRRLDGKLITRKGRAGIFVIDPVVVPPYRREAYWAKNCDVVSDKGLQNGIVEWKTKNGSLEEVTCSIYPDREIHSDKHSTFEVINLTATVSLGHCKQVVDQ